MIQSITILGSAGRMGRLLAACLCAQGVRVVGADLKEQPSAANFTCIQCDAAASEPVLVAALRETDGVFVCLSEAAALRCVPLLSEYLPNAALLVDTLSTKSRFLRETEHLTRRVELLSIDPLFGPDLGFADQNVVVTRRCGGPKAESLLSLLNAWGANLVYMTGEEHDRTMAYVQAATHVAILAFGSTLVRLGYDLSTVQKTFTPPHRVLLALLARIVAAEPEVYWDIQRGNSTAEHVRASFLQCLSEIDETIRAGDQSGFRSMLEEIRSMLGLQMFPLAADAAVLLGANRNKDAGSVGLYDHLLPTRKSV
jgi:4-amino-4-deoxyprephenate dehydrogenase